MECPFCKEEINDLALSCGRCGKDISFLAFRELRGQLASALARIEALETAAHTLSAHVEAMDGQTRHAHAHAPIRGAVVVSAAAWIALPIFLLLLAHWTLISVLDLDPRTLRVASILIPLPFGLRRFGSVIGTLWAGLFIATAGVLSMLLSTSLMDHVPILPQDIQSWIEILQYIASIGLAYLAGNLIGWRWRARKSRTPAAKGLTGEIAAALARGTAKPDETGAGLHRRIAAIAGWINTAMVVVTAVGAVLTALGKFWSAN